MLSFELRSDHFRRLTKQRRHLPHTDRPYQRRCGLTALDELFDRIVGRMVPPGAGLARGLFVQRSKLMTGPSSTDRRDFLATSAAVGLSGLVGAPARAANDSSPIRPFRVEIPDDVLNDLKRRVQATRWP